jgi:DNA-binding XRE family transcriptional regulator
MIEYAKIIKNFREAVGKSQQEMADLLGMTFMSYFDLELHDDELCSIPSLREVKKMCDIFGISPTELLTGNQKLNRLPAQISFQALMEKVKIHLVEKRQTQEEFEDEAGWHLSDYLADPEKIWDEPISFLQDICEPLGVDWVATIPR